LKIGPVHRNGLVATQPSFRNILAQPSIRANPPFPVGHYRTPLILLVLALENGGRKGSSELVVERGPWAKGSVFSMWEEHKRMGETPMAKEQQIHVGDVVRFQFGVRMVNSVVKEDRGPIGMKGRHLYLIQFDAEPGAFSQIELTAHELKRVRDVVSS
jgi:hypothetical protein